MGFHPQARTADDDVDGFITAPWIALGDPGIADEIGLQRQTAVAKAHLLVVAKLTDDLDTAKEDAGLLQKRLGALQRIHQHGFHLHGRVFPGKPLQELQA